MPEQMPKLDRYPEREIFRRGGRYVQCQVLNWSEGLPPKYIVCHPIERDALTGDFIARQGMGTWMEVDLLDIIYELNQGVAALAK